MYKYSRACALIQDPPTIWSFIIAFYLLFGGAIFLAVEGPNEREQLLNAEAERAAAIAELEMQAANLTAVVADTTNFTIEEAEAFTSALVNASQRVALAIVNLPSTTAPIWEYGPSVFFASTVITTIGEFGVIYTCCSNLSVSFHQVMVRSFR